MQYVLNLLGKVWNTQYELPIMKNLKIIWISLIFFHLVPQLCPTDSSLNCGPGHLFASLCTVPQLCLNCPPGISILCPIQLCLSILPIRRLMTFIRPASHACLLKIRRQQGPDLSLDTDKKIKSVLRETFMVKGYIP